MEKKNFFFAGLVVLAVFCFGLFSCTTEDHETALETVVRSSVGSTDTVVIDNSMYVNITTINRGDTIDIIEDITTPEKEYSLRGKAFIWFQKTGYQITADQETLTPEFANKGMAGGSMVKEEVKDNGYTAVYRYSYPTEDGNVVNVEVRMPHINGIPSAHPTASTIQRFFDPTATRGEMYKVKDAPVRATDLITFETEGFKNDTTFSETLVTDCERDLMAEEDIDHYELVSQGTKPVDPTTVKDSVLIRVVMKSGAKNEVVNYNVRKNEFTSISFEADVVSDFSGYRFGNVIGISAYEAEKKVAERSTGNWTVYSKKDVYSAAIAGEIPFNTKYYLQTERAQYKDENGIQADFDYIIPEVKEEGTNLNTVTSDREGYDKAVVTNNITVKYAGYNTPLSETKALYKKQVVKDEVVDENWDEASAKKEYAPTTITTSVDWVVTWKSGKQERTNFSKTFPRKLVAQSNWTKVASDASQTTGKPSLTTQKSEKKDGEWTWTEDLSSISSRVALNGASADNVWQSAEANDIKVTHEGKTFNFGHDGYSVGNAGAVGVGKVNGDYMEYPYSSTLAYIFGSADAKKSVAPGTIQVEEKRFFPKEWGALKAAYVTVVPNEDRTHCMYTFSLHFEKGTLPVINRDDALAPEWNFNYFTNDTNPKFNGGYWFAKEGKLVNTINKDEEDWMEFYDTTGKKSYGIMRYDTAKKWGSGWDKGKKDKPSVNTSRYEIKVTNGTLFIKDTYQNKNLTDKNVNAEGGWR
jgi:hypothetical protein